MKKVLIGFEHQALMDAVGSYVRSMGLEDLEFQTAATKALVLQEIADGDYSAVILMEHTSREEWSIDELCQMKESYPLNLIPIISEDYKGKQELSAFCNAGITTAVFINKRNTYNVEEVAKMIFYPRTLKDAKVYYGISTIADLRGGGTVLDEVTYEAVRNAILYEDQHLPLGERYTNAIGNLTPMQVADFLKRLDENTLNDLKKTVEFYDVLEALKKSKVIKSYRTPREIRKLRKRGQSIEPAPETETGSDIEYEKEIVEAEHVVVKGEDEEEEDAAEAVNLEDDFSISDDTDEGQEDDFSIVFNDPNDVADEDDDFTLAAEIENIKKEREPVANSKQPKQKMGKSQETESSTSVREENDDTEKTKKPRKKKKLSELDEIPEEDEKEEDAQNKKLALIIAVVGVALVLFFAMLVVLYFNISNNRKREAAAAATPSGYNTLYNTDEVAKYEVGENGGVILQDDDGNVLYEGNSSRVDNSSGQQAESSDSSQMQEEEIALDVIEEPESAAGTVNQTFNDVSAFEADTSYKGLDLVNLLNGNSGADCTLKMKNGSSIDIKRGNASIEEFKPSGMYKCSIDGSQLYFTEE